ncbi:MAG: 50S ribosomal protein L20 [Planctomycetota bacterium]|jgi:large subunit ribosomal protein L20
MVRVHTGVAHHKRVKRLLKRAKGYRGQRSKNLRSAKPTVLRAGAFAYAHRRLRRRDIRKLWIVRINAAVRAEGLTYSRFMELARIAKLGLDRKSLSELAARDPAGFTSLVGKVKSAAKS